MAPLGLCQAGVPWSSAQQEQEQEARDCAPTCSRPPPRPTPCHLRSPAGDCRGLRLRGCLNAPGTAVVQGGSCCGQGRCLGCGGPPPLQHLQRAGLSSVQGSAAARRPHPGHGPAAHHCPQGEVACQRPGSWLRAPCGPHLAPCLPSSGSRSCGRGRPVQPSFVRGSQPHPGWAGREVGAGQGPAWSGTLLTCGGDPMSPPWAPVDFTRATPCTWPAGSPSLSKQATGKALEWLRAFSRGGWLWGPPLFLPA